jgi:hypothetical protein
MDVRRQARDQVVGLSAQFLSGMGISLIGPPSETTGAGHTVSNVLLGLHVLIGAALIAGAAGAVRAARDNDRYRRLAHWGAAAIVLTFGAGITTLITKSNWWSYAMAVGFLVSLLVYVSLWSQEKVGRLPSDPERGVRSKGEGGQRRPPGQGAMR